SVYHEDASAVPEAVKKAVQERYPDATVRYYEYERYDDGRYVHEVELKGADGTEMEVSLYPDGQLKYAEKPMAIDALPQKVRDTVQSKVPGGTIDEVEVKEGPEMYQLHVRVKTSGNGDHYLTFTRDHTMMHHQIRYPAFIEVPAP
ncbi:MAG: PepSY-like domain-containing protein, partial [Myxococcota bacterium]